MVASLFSIEAMDLYEEYRGRVIELVNKCHKPCWVCGNCSYCCNAPLITTNIEACWILNSIPISLDGPVDSFLADDMCKFLVSGKCSIYEFRPTQCIRYYSFSREMCKFHSGGWHDRLDLQLIADGEALADKFHVQCKHLGFDVAYIDFISFSNGLILYNGRL